MKHSFMKIKLPKAYKIVIFIFILSLFVTFSVSFGRYVYKKMIDLYFTTKNFYFESDKLKSTEATYSLDYWNGVDPYDIVINLNSFKNDILKSSTDIAYNITYNCPSNVLCSSTKNGGTISSSTNTDSFVFTMTPNDIFSDGDRVTVRVVATSASPYVKSLSASFTFVVGRYGLSHEISDSSGSPYLTLKVTNTLDSYYVKEAFGDYSRGDNISASVYESLSSSNKAKCASAVITVSFNPNLVRVDNTATDYLKAYGIETQVINSYNYVKKFTFDMDRSISNVVKFYKVDKSLDYSNTNTVSVSYEY